MWLRQCRYKNHIKIDLNIFCVYGGRNVKTGVQICIIPRIFCVYGFYRYKGKDLLKSILINKKVNNINFHGCLFNR